MTGVVDDPEYMGIMPRAFQDVLQQQGAKMSVQASYMEVYNEEIRDLLSETPKRKLKLHEKPKTGVYVDGLSEHQVQSPDDLLELLNLGLSNRAIGATNMNAVSSRSHSLFQIKIEKVVNENKMSN